MYRSIGPQAVLLFAFYAHFSELTTKILEFCPPPSEMLQRDQNIKIYSQDIHNSLLTFQTADYNYITLNVVRSFP